MAIPDRHADTSIARLDDRSNASDADSARLEPVTVAHAAALLKPSKTRSTCRRVRVPDVGLSNGPHQTRERNYNRTDCSNRTDCPATAHAAITLPIVRARLGPVKALRRLFAPLRPRCAGLTALTGSSVEPRLGPCVMAAV
jgi:hypothetical protein